MIPVLDAVSPQTDASDAWESACDTLYAAAENPAHWAVALRDIANALDVDGAAVAGITRGGQITFSVIHGNLPSFPMPFNSSPGSQRNAAESSPDDDGIWTVVDRQSGHCAGVLLDCGLPEDVSFMVARRHERGPLTVDHLRHLRRVVQHIRRAVRISLEIESLTRRVALGRTVSNRMNAGVIAICIEGRIAMSNEAADRMLDLEDGLVRNGRALHAQRPSDDVKLQAMISAARRGAVAGQMPPPRAVLIGRRSGAQPYSLSVSGWQPPAAIFGADPKVLVIVRDAAAIYTPSEEHIRELVGLSPAESRLVRRLLEGDTLQVAAASLAISSNTARTQLRSIFSKTATRRQVDLIRLLTLMFETSSH